MHAYKPKVNDFVLAPTPAKTFGALQPAGLYFHMALLANISFQDVPAGKTPVPRNQWFPTVQRRRYGSNRGKTMIQGTFQEIWPLLAVGALGRVPSLKCKHGTHSSPPRVHSWYTRISTDCGIRNSTRVRLPFLDGALSLSTPS